VHVVTKILLVFCAVLSLLLAALTMSYAANASEIRAGYKAMELEKLAAQSARDDLSSQWQQQVAKWEADIKAANDGLDSVRAENANLQAQRTELRTQLEQAKAAAEAAANRIVDLAGTANTLADLNKVQREEVSRLRDVQVQSSRREAELLDRLNDLESQREVLEQNARALQERLKETQLELTTAKGGGTVNDPNQPFEYVGSPIFARVTEVFKSPNQEDMVTISEGSNRNIRQNMIMNIVRGDKFIAKLIITTVEPNRAVGRIDKLGKEVAVQTDDRVLSTLLK
jgi:multidrug efflux pump subunit AcrA (membrane-fusion protein)